MAKLEKKILEAALTFNLNIDAIGKNGMTKNESRSVITLILCGIFAWSIYAFSVIDSGSKIHGYIVLGGYVLLLIALAYRFYLRSKKGIVAFVINRKLGVIHFPKNVNSVRENTYSIEDLHVDYNSKSVFEKRDDGQHHLVYPILSLHKKNGNFEGAWSLVIWYMDKNRPLPPGTAFDPYRQKDFERRKAEGFPKPLYPSNIPTLEATPKQQAERERIGGW